MSKVTQFKRLKIQLEAIISATNNFADENCIGAGGFGKVYMGEIDHSRGQQTMVALKRLDRKFGQGDPEFWKEIMLLSLYKHENIVSLLGYCDDSGEKILMYEYVSRKSLDLYLDKGDLTWVQRLNICIGAARGLAYLHTPAKTKLRILHRDIKSSNILLDENWNAKISDFGLSKFGPANQRFSYLITDAVGTPFYCDPLYAETGLLTKESDVYSFGVVLFEVLCGRLCFGNKKHQPLIGLVRKYYEKGNISEIVYGNIKDDINNDSLVEFTKIAYQSLKRERRQRPLMSQVVEALENALKYQCPEPSTPKPAGILKVKVLRTTGVRRSLNPFATSNHYLILSVNQPDIRFTQNMRSTTKQNKVNPEWNEEFNLYVEDFDVQSLWIFVNNMLSVEKHESVGHANMKLGNLTPDIPKTCDLEILKYDGKQNIVGILMVEAVFKPLAFDHIPTDIADGIQLQKAPIGTPEGGGLLVVRIREACLGDLQDTINVSVSVLFRGELRNTPIMINDNISPRWEEEFTFMLEDPPTNENLHMEVISNLWRRKEIVGSVDINLEEVVSKKWIIKSYKVLPKGYYSNWLDVELQWRTLSEEQMIGGSLSKKYVQDKMKWKKVRR